VSSVEDDATTRSKLTTDKDREMVTSLKLVNLIVPYENPSPSKVYRLDPETIEIVDDAPLNVNPVVVNVQAGAVFDIVIVDAPKVSDLVFVPLHTKLPHCIFLPFVFSAPLVCVIVAVPQFKSSCRVIVPLMTVVVIPPAIVFPPVVILEVPEFKFKAIREE
jgi:hypothetical protein